jgi:hypothetical protein
MKVILAYSYLTIIIVTLISLCVYGSIVNNDIRVAVLCGIGFWIFWMSIMWSIFTIGDYRARQKSN